MRAGVKVCCGGIVGMGETRADRIGLLHTLATLAPQPESVPINELVPIPGTPLASAAPLDPFEFVRCIAVARILMPRSHVRLSAGRSDFSDELQALCFFAGANSIFYGEKLLTTGNPDTAADRRLFERLGLAPEDAGMDARGRATQASMVVAAGSSRRELELAAAASTEAQVSLSLDDALPEKRAARRAFDRAREFESACFIHDEARGRLLERLELMRLTPKVVVDLGCATGLGANALATRYPGARVLAVDSSLGMLRATAGNAAGAVTVIGGDAERLPLNAASADLVLANLVLPWCRPDRLFAETARVLADGGALLFATFGPGHAAGG